MTAAVEAVGLTKTYGPTRALTDLDLRVEPGECFGYLGPNGAGKTTTIRLLLALQRPTRGRITVLGLDPRVDDVEVHRRVGYLPGDLSLFPRLTGRRLLEWFGRARGTDLVYADELVERFDVVVDRPVRELSTGNRRKIGLVLACLHRPDLLVLDEPTSGLDPLMQDEFVRLVRETVDDGRTVFLSSHELDEVQRVADRVAIIKGGRLVTTDSVDHLRHSAPRKVEARFSSPVDPAAFSCIPGVSVLAHHGGTLSLEVTGRMGPVLTAIGALDPVDVTARHADLDELFRTFYRDTTPEPAPEPTRAH